MEPIAGVTGASLVLLITPLLPYALSFAAGAMIFALDLLHLMMFEEVLNLLEIKSA